MNAEINGNVIDYSIAGEGEPLLLLNGVMMTARSWAPVATALAERYRCVTHDFRGQLRSGRPEGPYVLAQHVEDIAALMDLLEIDSAHLVGTSYGGELAMMFALAYPERVRTLTVIACVALADEPMHARVSRWANAARETPDALYDLTVTDNYSPAFIDANRELVQAGRERLATYPPDWYRAFADLCDAALTLDVSERLHEIRCPALVVAAERDLLKPLHHSRELAEGMRAELVVIEGAGHAVVIEQPQAVSAAVLAFLRSASTAGND